MNKPAARVHVNLILSQEDHAWVRAFGEGDAAEGVKRLIDLYRAGQRPVIEANGPVVHRVKRPVYQAEE